ncbi:MAG: OsmC family protein [Sandaracinus sp.]|nr:OsmC family protein [Myxococcales bacterium]MCB9611184.1 OsmC family protein [Sandaracinus sp.]MCB9621064.1 OsmC family protein [Sandaracinus sp.]
MMKLVLRRVGVSTFEAENERGQRVRVAGSADLEARILERVPDRSVLPQADAYEAGGAMRPMELFLVSFAACSAMDVVLIVTRQKEDLRELTIAIEGDRADATPAVFERIRIHFEAPGVDEAKLSRAATLGVKKYCSVGSMLRDEVDVSVTVSAPSR